MNIRQLCRNSPPSSLRLPTQAHPHHLLVSFLHIRIHLYTHQDKALPNINASANDEKQEETAPTDSEYTNETHTRARVGECTSEGRGVLRVYLKTVDGDGDSKKKDRIREIGG